MTSRWRWATVVAAFLAACAADAPLGPATQPSGSPHLPISLHFDDSALAVALDCHHEALPWTEHCIRRLEETTGHRVSMGAMGTFGEPFPVAVLGKILKDTVPQDSSGGPYGVSAFSRNIGKVRAIRALLASKYSGTEIVDLVSSFLPAEAGRTGSIAADVLLVPFGHRHGDAYVRSIARKGGTPVLDDSGAPAIVLNLGVVAATYPGDAEEVARSLQGVLAHEVFHIASAHVRRSLGVGTTTPNGLDRFLRVLLDEGIAHHVDQVAQAGGTWSFPRDRAVQSMDAMDSALRGLADPAVPPAQVDEILIRATVGRYWEKFGSVGGMLLVSGVEERCGRAEIRRLVTTDPRCLPAAYGRCRPGALPPLGPQMVRIVASAPACGSPREALETGGREPVRGSGWDLLVHGGGRESSRPRGPRGRCRGRVAPDDRGRPRGGARSGAGIARRRLVGGPARGCGGASPRALGAVRGRGRARGPGGADGRLGVALRPRRPSPSSRFEMHSAQPPEPQRSCSSPSPEVS